MNFFQISDSQTFSRSAVLNRQPVADQGDIPYFLYFKTHRPSPFCSPSDKFVFMALQHRPSTRLEGPMDYAPLFWEWCSRRAADPRPARFLQSSKRINFNWESMDMPRRPEKYANHRPSRTTTYCDQGRNISDRGRWGASEFHQNVANYGKYIAKTIPQMRTLFSAHYRKHNHCLWLLRRTNRWNRKPNASQASLD